MGSRRKLLVVTLFALLAACDASRIPGVWQSYQHPTYRFTVRAPRSWKIEPLATMGTAVELFPPSSDPLFRPNMNIVVQDRKEDLELAKLADLSVEQLRFVLNRYKPLAKAPLKLGNLSAIELRGSYEATEGTRIIRTIMAYRLKTEVIVTITYRAEKEQELTPDFNRVLSAFKFPES